MVVFPLESHKTFALLPQKGNKFPCNFTKHWKCNLVLDTSTSENAPDHSFLLRYAFLHSKHKLYHVNKLFDLRINFVLTTKHSKPFYFQTLFHKNEQILTQNKWIKIDQDYTRITNWFESRFQKIHSQPHTSQKTFCQHHSILKAREQKK